MMDVKALLCEERLYECWKGPLTRWREARPKTLAGTGFIAFPRAVAPVLIYGVPPDVHSAMAQSGHLPLFRSSNMVLSSKEMATAKQPIGTRKMANACVVPPLPRPVREESANTTTETIIAGKYAKITERGSGQYQRFVRPTHFLIVFKVLLLFPATFYTRATILSSFLLVCLSITPPGFKRSEPSAYGA